MEEGDKNKLLAPEIDEAVAVANPEEVAMEAVEGASDSDSSWIVLDEDEARELESAACAAAAANSLAFDPLSLRCEVEAVVGRPRQDTDSDIETLDPAAEAAAPTKEMSGSATSEGSTVVVGAGDVSCGELSLGSQCSFVSDGIPIADGGGGGGGGDERSVRSARRSSAASADAEESDDDDDDDDDGPNYVWEATSHDLIRGGGDSSSVVGGGGAEADDHVRRWTPDEEQRDDGKANDDFADLFAKITKGHTYMHTRNKQVNVLLSGLLVVFVAMVVGLGVGHFLGWSERLELQEHFAEVREEKLEAYRDNLVTCMTGDESLGGDDQDLDDRVIEQLHEENSDLRDEVEFLRQNLNNEPSEIDEELTVILRDRINDLLTANADLESEVVRLRYGRAPDATAADAPDDNGAADAARAALRDTQQELNNVANENDQLKIAVAKARYSQPVACPSAPATAATADLKLDFLWMNLRDAQQQLNTVANENDQLKIEVAKARYGEPVLSARVKERINILQTENEDLKREVRKIRYVAAAQSAAPPAAQSAAPPARDLAADDGRADASMGRTEDEPSADDDAFFDDGSCGDSSGPLPAERCPQSICGVPQHRSSAAAAIPLDADDDTDEGFVEEEELATAAAADCFDFGGAASEEAPPAAATEFGAAGGADKGTSAEEDVAAEEVARQLAAVLASSAVFVESQGANFLDAEKIKEVLSSVVGDGKGLKELETVIADKFDEIKRSAHSKDDDYKQILKPAQKLAKQVFKSVLDFGKKMQSSGEKIGEKVAEEIENFKRKWPTVKDDFKLDKVTEKIKEKVKSFKDDLKLDEVTDKIKAKVKSFKDDFKLDEVTDKLKEKVKGFKENLPKGIADKVSAGLKTFKAKLQGMPDKIIHLFPDSEEAGKPVASRSEDGGSKTETQNGPWKKKGENKPGSDGKETYKRKLDADYECSGTNCRWRIRRDKTDYECSDDAECYERRELEDTVKFSGRPFDGGASSPVRRPKPRTDDDRRPKPRTDDDRRPKPRRTDDDRRKFGETKSRDGKFQRPEKRVVRMRDPAADAAADDDRKNYSRWSAPDARRADTDKWLFERANKREQLRKEETKSDWLFERAKQRKELHDAERKSDWLFERATQRRHLQKKASVGGGDWSSGPANQRKRSDAHAPDGDKIILPPRAAAAGFDHRRKNDMWTTVADLFDDFDDEVDDDDDDDDVIGFESWPGGGAGGRLGPRGRAAHAQDAHGKRRHMSKREEKRRRYHHSSNDHHYRQNQWQENNVQDLDYNKF